MFVCLKQKAAQRIFVLNNLTSQGLVGGMLPINLAILAQGPGHL